MTRRCSWCGTDPIYTAYHDHEWGRPQYDDQKLWESFILDGFQAGLSWITILRRRDGFRAAFDGFDPARIAAYDDDKIEALRNDARIIRNKAKIKNAIHSARLFLEMETEGGFSKFVWRFVDHKPKINHLQTESDIPAFDENAEALSKALYARGFRFCGPTIVYAFMQANGLVNDHVAHCDFRNVG